MEVLAFELLRTLVHSFEDKTNFVLFYILRFTYYNGNEIFVFSRIVGLVKYYNFLQDINSLSLINQIKHAKFHSHHFQRE